jgi:hypothetical protein
MSQTQLGDVVANLLANAFDVIENANLAADELHNPNCKGISLGASAAEIKKRFGWQNRISTDTTDATLGFCLSKPLSEISALECLGVFAFPNVVAVLPLPPQCAADVA